MTLPEPIRSMMADKILRCRRLEGAVHLYAKRLDDLGLGHVHGRCEGRHGGWARSPAAALPVADGAAGDAQLAG
jgi:hypothetical protein